MIYPQGCSCFHTGLLANMVKSRLLIRLVRWTMNLQEFNLTKEHTPDQQQAKADVLSRLEVQDSEETYK